MKALAVDQPGSVDNLELMDMETPEPGPQEVRVKVHAVGLNPVDYKLIEGGGLPEWQFPHVSGLDVAGEVDKTGSGVTDWKPGDRVYFHASLAHQGGFARFVTASRDVLAPLPDGWDFAEAAALPTPAFTAYQALHRKVRMHKGGTILIQAGAGAVGGFAIQLAARAGMRILTTCSPENNEYVKGLGAHQTIDYHTENIVEKVHEYTNGRGVDIAMDMVGSKTSEEAFDYLAYNADLICVADLPDMQRYTPKTLAPSIHEIALGFVYRSEDYEQIADLGRMAKEVGDLAAAGELVPMLEEEINLEDVPDALRRMRDQRIRGNITAHVTHSS
ncbi:zinc-binding dehydrogenase [Salibacterium halotolerans]|uniref:NADPH:quinone reductase n=1 Tax=Salibacterium halotolerans TaxID=1884432 RepID=A0A1I5X2B2_9BACI|nr:zinc-binding dehydrogenase [Salibacterium halotolerans]SFQ26068.1 NADPH:quinone reductase [Salibacterium halotolerans]